MISLNHSIAKVQVEIFSYLSAINHFVHPSHDGWMGKQSYLCPYLPMPLVTPSPRHLLISHPPTILIPCMKCPPSYVCGPHNAFFIFHLCVVSLAHGKGARGCIWHMGEGCMGVGGSECMVGAGVGGHMWHVGERYGWNWVVGVGMWGRGGRTHDNAYRCLRLVRAKFWIFRLLGLRNLGKIDPKVDPMPESQSGHGQGSSQDALGDVQADGCDGTEVVGVVLTVERYGLC